eukprot:7011981-Karenia_brevis.AAC.1
MRISVSNGSTCCHCPTFSQAEMAVLKLITRGLKPSLQISSSDDTTRCRCPPITHAEMAA